MSTASATASIELDSDWGTLQLTSKGAILEPLKGFDYPKGTVFTATGVLIGKPYSSLSPQKVTISVTIQSPSSYITLLTGHGNRGTSGPFDGSVTVTLGDDYSNTSNNGDGMNFQVFHDVHLPEGTPEPGSSRFGYGKF